MTDTIRTTNTVASPRPARFQPRVLEPRVLLDAAAVETAAAVAADAGGDAAAAPVDTSVLFDAPAVSGRREAYVVDTAVQGYESLLTQVPDGAELFLIDSSKPGLGQLNAALDAAGGQFDAIHVVSHGAGGTLNLGSDTVSSATLASHEAALQALGSHITENGDLLLYGCDIAGTADGAQFLTRLATLTGADVAASTNATGGAHGDGVLEAWAGVDGIQADSWSAVNVLSAPLALDGLYGGREDGDLTQADQQGWAVDGSGEWVVSAGNGTGEVQIWRVIGNTRTEQKITLPDATTAPLGVSISGDTFVVGNPSAGTAGRVYVYRLNSATMLWSRVQTLDVATLVGVPADSRIGGWADGDNGGNQWIAVSGNHIAVGSPNEGSGTGRVIWFSDKSVNLDWSDTSATGLTRNYFDEPDATETRIPDGINNESNARFGASVAIAQDILVVGSPGADLNGDQYLSTEANHGAVFVFNWGNGSSDGPVTGKPNSGTGAAYILRGNADAPGGGGLAQNAYFGASVDIEYYKDVNNPAAPFKYTIVGGATGEDGGKGEIYIYQTTTASIATLNTSASNIYGQTTGGGADRFGLATAVSSGRVIVGAPNHNATTDAAVFYYESATNVWTGINTNNPALNGIFVKSWTAASYGPGMAADDRFGRSLAFTNGNNVAAGAPQFGADNRGTVAFFFARTPVAVNDSFTLTENAGVTTFNPKTNDLYGSETDATVLVTPIIPSGLKGVFVWNPDATTFTYNPNGQFEYLSADESEVVRINYQLKTTTGGITFISSAEVVVTITGVNDAPVLDAGINNITVPRVNEPNGNPAGAQTPSTGSIVLPFNAFGDVDQSDILTYSALSIVKVGGAGAATIAPTITPGGNISVGGSYNKVANTNTGAITYNMAGLGPTYADTVWRVTVQASDGNGGTVSTTFDFTIGRDNQNPETTPIPGMAATEDAVFSYDFEADDNINVFGYFRDLDTTSESDPYAETLTYSIVSQSGPGADWLSISAAGVLTGAPSNENVGVHSVKLMVTDFYGNTIESNVFTITVGNTNDAPDLVNEIDRKVSIKGETFSFNVQSGALVWGGVTQPNEDLGPYPSPNNYFYDSDNSTADGRGPSSGDTMIFTAYNAVSGTQISNIVGSGGTAGGTNDLSWLRFDGTSFSGTSAGVLGSTITIRLRATDNHGAFTETEFEIGIFPRVGAGVESGALPTPEYAAQVGYDVAINSGTTAAGQGMAGKWAVVGAPGADGGSGRIYIYENTAGAAATPVWVLNNSFTTAVGSYARLGASVDISADGLKIVAGAPNEDTNGATAGSRQGAVYFYTNNGAGVWTANAVAKATSPDADNGDQFGSAVAINQDGTKVLVGAPKDDAAGINAGAAYMFNFGVATGANKLLPIADTTESRAGDEFGSSVAFDQGVLVIGAPRDDHSGKVDAGSAYVYSSAAVPVFGMKLKKDAMTVANNDYFGTSVDVDAYGAGNNSVLIAIGTPKDDKAGNDAGAVYIYRSTTGHTGFTASTSEVLTAYDVLDQQEFGSSVAIDVDELTGEIRMAVGSGVSGAPPGTAYAYRYWGASGWLGQRYTPATISAAVKFGYAVDVAGSVFIVGAPDTNRTGGVASTDLGSLQPESGKYYSFNSKVATGGQVPIEALSSAAPIDKVADSGQPNPVILSSGNSAGNGGNTGGIQSSFFASLLGSDRDDEWELLLRPVTDWSLGATDVRFMAAANSTLASVNPYSDAVLFDQRTKADAAVLDVAAAEQGEPAAKEAPTEEGAPEAAPETAEEAPLAMLLKGFSTQLEAANGARARDARQLLSSLDSLAS